jgi:hypothetical protein
MKIKHLFLGFVIGAVIFSAIPIKAAIEEYVLYKADYKIMVDGNEYADQELPILNYKGNTYIPLRKVSDLLGVKLNWNAELGQAEITKTTIEGVNTMETQTTTIKFTSLREIGMKYGLVIGSKGDDKLHIQKGDFEIIIDNLDLPTEGQKVVKTNKGNLTIRRSEGSYDFIIDELKAIGLIE